MYLGICSKAGRSISFKPVNRQDRRILKIVHTRYIVSGGNCPYGKTLNTTAMTLSIPGTCLVGIYNSVLKFYLAEPHKKTKCYNKPIQML